MARRFCPGTKDLGCDLRIRNGCYEGNLPELNVPKNRLCIPAVKASAKGIFTCDLHRIAYIESFL
jgi:hypothetical protein